jgi:hypothetical protein
MAVLTLIAVGVALFQEWFRRLFQRVNATNIHLIFDSNHPYRVCIQDVETSGVWIPAVFYRLKIENKGKNILRSAQVFLEHCEKQNKHGGWEDRRILPMPLQWSYLQERKDVTKRIASDIFGGGEQFLDFGDFQVLDAFFPNPRFRLKTMVASTKITSRKGLLKDFWISPQDFESGIYRFKLKVYGSNLSKPIDFRVELELFDFDNKCREFLKNPEKNIDDIVRLHICTRKKHSPCQNSRVYRKNKLTRTSSSTKGT